MTYRIDATKPVDEEVRRIARDEVGSALKDIEDPDVDTSTTVHEVRKRCKKLRALLRLVRDAAPDLYQRENRALRDTARTISMDRDADVVLETFDLLMTGDGEAPGGGSPSAGLGSQARARLRRALEGGDGPGGSNAAGTGDRLREVEQQLRSVEERLDTWDIPDRGFKAIRKGLARSYARARKGMKQASKAATPEHFHEWRKRAKDHRYHVELLRDLWKPVLSARADELHRLTDLLGEDHDLAVLSDALLERAGGTDPIEGLTDAIELIRARRDTLQSEMPALGKRLFAEKPDPFLRRFAAYYAAARLG